MPHAEKFGNIWRITGDVDPSAGAGLHAPVGSEYLRENGETWKKTGDEATEWEKLATV